MADYKRHGSHRPFHKPGSGNRDLFQAECNSCHTVCQVPFRPNGKKPVYCSGCYKRDDERPHHSEQRHQNAPRTFAPPLPDRSLDELKRDIKTMQATLERLAVAFENANRAAALTKEVRKHVPAAKPAAAPVKKPSVKKPVKKAAKKKA